MQCDRYLILGVAVERRRLRLVATWQGTLSPSLPRIVTTLWFHCLSHPVIFTCTPARLRIWNRSTQVGSIEAGAVADCVLYDLDAFSLLPHADPIVSLVLSSARPTIGTYSLEQVEPSLHFVQNNYQDYFNTITGGKN